MAGLVGYMGFSFYVASKFAVRGLTEAMRTEFLNTGLTICEVFPGVVPTNIAQNSPLMTAEGKSDAERR